MKFPRIIRILLGIGLTTALLRLVIDSALAQPSQTPAIRVEGDGDPRGPGIVDPRAEASLLLDMAMKNIERIQSIKAGTRQGIDLLGKRVNGSGTYLEMKARAVTMFRLELQFQLNGGEKTVLQVSDGIYLWTVNPLIAFIPETVSRIDLRQVRRALQDQPNAAGPPDMMRYWHSMGGLTGLVAGLRDNFDFNSVQKVQLDPRLPAYQLRGEWKKDKLVALLPGQTAAIQEGRPLDYSKMRPHLPDSVAVYLEDPKLLPRRIEYHRRYGSANDPAVSTEDRIVAYIDLSETRITDASAVHLSRFRQLTSLSLRRTCISDEAAALLQVLDRLEVLDVGETWMTKEGLNALLKLPRLANLRCRFIDIDSKGLDELMVQGHLTKWDDIEGLYNPKAYRLRRGKFEFLSNGRDPFQ